jgi:hypothetical protein
MDTQDPEALLLLVCIRLRLQAAFACVAHRPGSKIPEELEGAVRSLAVIFTADPAGAGPASNAGPKRALAKWGNSGSVLFFSLFSVSTMCSLCCVWILSCMDCALFGDRGACRTLGCCPISGDLLTEPSSHRTSRSSHSMCNRALVRSSFAYGTLLFVCIIVHSYAYTLTVNSLCSAMNLGRISHTECFTRHLPGRAC